VISAKKIGI